MTDFVIHFSHQLKRTTIVNCSIFLLG